MGFLEEWILQKSVKERISVVEKELVSLKTAAGNENLHQEIKQLQFLIEQMMSQTKTNEQPIRIEYIEKVYIDRYETNNNIGAIGH